MPQAPNHMPTQLNRRYLRVQDLRSLRHLFFSSKRVVDGHYAGRHASPRRGRAVEFSDYRQYTPGDEIGDIDWQAFARSDRLFVKLSEHQSDMTVNLLVDASASMGYPVEKVAGSAELSKYDYACMLAAAIAFLVTRQRDKVALGIARHGLQRFHHAVSSFTHLDGILQAMEQTQPKGKADLADAAAAMAGQTGRKGLVVVFTDLFEDQDQILDAMTRFIHRGNEVVIFQILHPDELALPDAADAVFIDSETDLRLTLDVADVRPVYERRLRRFLDSWSAACRSRGIDYNLASIATPYNLALRDYLFARTGMT